MLVGGGPDDRLLSVAPTYSLPWERPRNDRPGRRRRNPPGNAQANGPGEAGWLWRAAAKAVHRRGRMALTQHPISQVSGQRGGRCWPATCIRPTQTCH